MSLPPASTHPQPRTEQAARCRHAALVKTRLDAHGGHVALVSYLPGGGDHATTKLVKYQIVGVDLGFDHSAPLDASGNALGPFTVGQTIKIITEVSNSAGTRTTAPRTIIIVEPVV